MPDIHINFSMSAWWLVAIVVQLIWAYGIVGWLGFKVERHFWPLYRHQKQRDRFKAAKIIIAGPLIWVFWIVCEGLDARTARRNRRRRERRDAAEGSFA